MCIKYRSGEPIKVDICVYILLMFIMYHLKNHKLTFQLVNQKSIFFHQESFHLTYDMGKSISDYYAREYIHWVCAMHLFRQGKILFCLEPCTITEIWDSDVTVH